MPSGTTRSLATCQPAPSSTRTTRLSGPAPTSRAKAARISLNIAVLTASARNHSPVAGREDVEPLEPVMAERQRALAAARPDPADDRLEAGATIVAGPALRRPGRLPRR